MSQPLLDVHPVSFRVGLTGGSQYKKVTTVLDHVIYNTEHKRKQVLDRLKRASLTAAVWEELRAVCRELLAQPERPQTVYQRLTTVTVQEDNDSAETPASAAGSSGALRPQSFTLVVTINAEGTADRVWESVVSHLDRFSVSAAGSQSAMLPPRRSRRLSVLPEPAAAAPSSRAGRGRRTGRLVSPARRPAAPAPAARAAASRRTASPPKPAARRTASPPKPAARRGTASPPAARAAPAARRTTVARKKVTSPVSTISTASTVSRRSTTTRSTRRAVAASPPAAASRRQSTARRLKAATPPRKSSLSPVKGGAARRNQHLSPSFAREVRVRTLRGSTDEMMTEFELPDGFTGSKRLLVEELMASPTVVLETPGLLKKFSKKLKESVFEMKSVTKSPEPVTKSPEPVTKLPSRPSRSTTKPSSETKPSDAKKRSRAESRSPSASPPKKTRVSSGDSPGAVTTGAAAVADSPPLESLSRQRARPSLASVRKSLNASLVAAPRAASSPASPVLRIRTPAATPAAAIKVTRTGSQAEAKETRAETPAVTRVTRNASQETKETRAETAAVAKVTRSTTSTALTLSASPSVTTKVTRSTTAVSQTITDSSAVRSARRPVTAAPLDSPERSAGVKALLTARSSIRRRPAGQPPPEELSASPTLKPAREAASAALSRAYLALARSEAKQKDLFKSQVAGVAAMASPALKAAEKTVDKPAEKPADKRADKREEKATEKPAAEKVVAAARVTRKSSAESQEAAKVIIDEPPAKPTSIKPAAEPTPQKAVTRSAAAAAAEPAVFTSPALGGTPRGQLAPRSSVRRAPASALRRVLDRAPESAAARSSVRRVLRRPSPPPDRAAGGDSPLLLPEPPVTRARRAKLASELTPPLKTHAEPNNVSGAGLKQPQTATTGPSDVKTGTETPQKRSPLRTACLMLLLLVAVVLGLLWLARGQLPDEQQQQLQQLQTAAEQQGRQLGRLLYQQAEAARDWLRQAAGQ